MPAWKLTFAIHHLAFYLAAVLFWLCFCPQPAPAVSR